MNDAAEDAADMRALQDGDIHALDRLMLRWQQPLRAYLLRHALSQEDAADLAQETFERVFRHRDRFDPTRRFSTWMFQIALNLLRDLSRRSSRRPTIALDHAPEPVTEQSPQDHALDREMAAAVSHAVAQLPPPLREAIILFEYEHQSHQEIALIVGATPKAIETRLRRARLQLRASLQRWLPA